jgi:hypothetical protein
MSVFKGLVAIFLRLFGWRSIWMRTGEGEAVDVGDHSLMRGLDTA